MLKNSAPIGEEKPPLYTRSLWDLVYSYVEHHCIPGDLVYYSILHQFHDFRQNYTPDLKNHFSLTQCTIQFYTRFKTQGICHDSTCVPKIVPWQGDQSGGHRGQRGQRGQRDMEITNITNKIIYSCSLWRINKYRQVRNYSTLPRS